MQTHNFCLFCVVSHTPCLRQRNSTKFSAAHFAINYDHFVEYNLNDSILLFFLAFFPLLLALRVDKALRSTRSAHTHTHTGINDGNCLQQDICIVARVSWKERVLFYAFVNKIYKICVASKSLFGGLLAANQQSALTFLTRSVEIVFLKLTKYEIK